jgi:glycosyltransferase involved in cell wall biosynthesis
MHILWISDSPDTPSGFGNVTRFVCDGLSRRGHRVSILGWQTQKPFDWNGCRVFATGSDPMGSDALYAYLVRHRPDAVIALADVWWLPYFTSPHVRRQMELIDSPWLLYFPIDGDTKDEQLPSSWIDMLREVDVPIAMSRYGQRIASRCGVKCEYIPHGVDLDVFCPPADRDEAKARVGASGRFLVLSDSRNQPRKLLPRLLDSFARFADGRPDALLHLHTDPDDEFARSGYYSYDVCADVRHLGLESQVRFSQGFSMKPGAGLPLRELAAYYQAADLHLLASSGEGFGLPTLQAAAAGAVPLASAYSASRELVEGHGEAIALEGSSEDEFGIRRVLIDVDDAAAKIARFYDDRDLLRDRSRRSREFALSYGWEDVIDQWDRLLRSIGTPRQRLGRSPFRKPSRAEDVVERVVPSRGGTSITVKMIRREYGRLEQSIAADARKFSTDIRLPTVPPPCELAGVRVPRRPGSIGLADADVPVFDALKRLFPILTGWIPSTSFPARVPEGDGLRMVPMENPEDAFADLSRSVLLLNGGGSLPESLLVNAALFGVVCIGTSRVEAQRVLWPELALDNSRAVLEVARALLTNPARMLEQSDRARLACRESYAPDEEQAATKLRCLFKAKQSGLSAARG